MRITIAVVFAAALTVSGSVREFMADAGASAVAFPNPDRPVADIVSPIWHSEKERDVAGEPRQLVRLLGIKSGMTVADIGAGSGYYVVRLSPIVGPHGRVMAEDVVPEYLRGCVDGCATLDCRTSQSAAASRTIRGYQLIRSTWRS
jgi:predicted methyltransferase